MRRITWFIFLNYEVESIWKWTQCVLYRLRPVPVLGQKETCTSPMDLQGRPQDHWGTVLFSRNFSERSALFILRKGTLCRKGHFSRKKSYIYDTFAVLKVEFLLKVDHFNQFHQLFIGALSWERGRTNWAGCFYLNEKSNFNTGYNQNHGTLREVQSYGDQ